MKREDLVCAINDKEASEGRRSSGIEDMEVMAYDRINVERGRQDKGLEGGMSA